MGRLGPVPDDCLEWAVVVMHSSGETETDFYETRKEAVYKAEEHLMSGGGINVYVVQVFEQGFAR